MLATSQQLKEYISAVCKIYPQYDHCIGGIKRVEEVCKEVIEGSSGSHDLDKPLTLQQAFAILSKITRIKDLDYRENQGSFFNERYFSFLQSVNEVTLDQELAQIETSYRPRKNAYDFNMFSLIIDNVTEQDLNQLPYLEAQDWFYISIKESETELFNHRIFINDPKHSKRFYFIVHAQLAFFYRQKRIRGIVHDQLATKIKCYEQSDSNIDLAMHLFQLQYLIIIQQDISYLDASRLCQEIKLYPAYQYLLLFSFNKEQALQFISVQSSLFFSLIKECMGFESEEHMIEVTQILLSLQDDDKRPLLTLGMFQSLQGDVSTSKERFELAKLYSELYQRRLLESMLELKYFQKKVNESDTKKQLEFLQNLIDVLDLFSVETCNDRDLIVDNIFYPMNYMLDRISLDQLTSIFRRLPSWVERSWSNWVWRCLPDLFKQEDDPIKMEDRLLTLSILRQKEFMTVNDAYKDFNSFLQSGEIDIETNYPDLVLALVRQNTSSQFFGREPHEVVFDEEKLAAKP